MVKLMGGTLLVSLVVIGIVGVIAIQERERNYHSNRFREIASLKEMGTKYNTAVMPRDLEYIAEISPAANPVLHYAIQGKTSEIKSYLPEAGREKIVNSAVEMNRHYFLKGKQNDPSLFFNVYYFRDKGILYEAGYNYLVYRKQIHEISLIIWIIIPIFSIILLIVLPLFFRNNMTRPVAGLLEGFRKVNDGSLDVSIPVLVKDEFGIIAESFNSMVVSIRDARKKLQNYAEHMEEMVSARTFELVEAQKETDEIMKNVDEGLFLIYVKEKEYSIGSQYSRELENIFMMKNLAAHNIVNLISLFCQSGVSENVRKYLNLMFRPSIEEETLFEMNPLVDVEFFVDGKRKYLNFKFRRVFKNDDIEYLIVTVVDTTEQILLQQRLRKTEADNKTRMGMLFKLLHVDPTMLSDFMEGAFSEMNKINDILKEHKNEDHLISKLDEMKRYVHTIKGNAGLLDLDFIAEIAHRMEDKMESLRWKENLRGEEFIPVAILHQDLVSVLKEMKELVDKLLNFQENFGEEGGKTTSIVLNALTKTIEKTGKLLGKNAVLVSDEFSLEHIDSTKRILVKDILIQFVRNSMAHGLEKPEERRAAGKNETGEIIITGKLKDGKYEMKVRDDGRGFQLDLIKQSAISAGIVSAEEISRYDDERIAGLIFHSGLSTSRDVSLISGRGVGLDLIKMKIIEAGGSITFNFLKDRFAEFAITLPVS